MKPSHTFLDHTADVLFTAEADDLSELFEQCGLAVEETQVELSLIEAKKTVKIKLEHRNVEMLLFNFLEELLFYKDAEQLLFSEFKATVREKPAGGYTLECTASGEKLDPEKHQPKVDVKAITMHMFEVKKTQEGWKAQVLVDI